jgi:hypothetical protein
MMPWDDWGWHWGMMLMMGLFWFALIVGLVLLVVRAVRQTQR